MAIADQGARTIRIAAAGDIHCRPSRREHIEQAFADLGSDVDIVLLAGDLTSTGDPGEAAILTSARAAVDAPVHAVLGNHDYHSGEHAELVEALANAGIGVLEGGAVIEPVAGIEVGIAGAKGFIGGFAGSHLPDFGEPSLRQVFAETTAEVEMLDHGLREIDGCPLRIALLHYSPVADTLAGERSEIWTFLGSDRLAGPIAEHEPDLVLHGHAHYGQPEGRIGATPVYNVSVPVIGRDFWTFEIEAPAVPVEPIH